ncbi:MAG: diacylglycerol kinase family lipid kinase [Myxococcales bacterium]|nr:diacylglycerol kinase family lipid kinase [Myxococcales bacterium]
MSAASTGPVVAIINPRSANGALGRDSADVLRVLRREVGACETLMTRAPGHATQLARDAIRGGASLVIAVGGDGTIHEVANGFFDDGRPAAGSAALGVLPVGTGGDFRRSAGIPKDLAAAAALLMRGERRPIDVGLLEQPAPGDGQTRRVFVNVASFGIPGLVDQIVNSSSKRLGGRLSFALGTLRAAVRYTNQRVRLVFDGNEDDHLEATINSVAVANGQYFGGGMRVAPDAALDDGRFDVVVIGDLSRFEILTSGPRIYAGTHVTLPKVRVRRAISVTAHPVDVNEQVLLDVDGETPGALPARFTLLSAALPVVLPARPA